MSSLISITCYVLNPIIIFSGTYISFLIIILLKFFLGDVFLDFNKMRTLILWESGVVEIGYV